MEGKNHHHFELIIRNPNESPSSSKNSSRFNELPLANIQSQWLYQPEQFPTSDLPQFQQCSSLHYQPLPQSNHQINKNTNSFCDQNQFQPTQINNFNHKCMLVNKYNTQAYNMNNQDVNANNMQPQLQLKYNIKQTHYPQRLTFQNQSVSPFISIKPTISNLNQQNNQESTQMKHSIQYQHMRHSFNPVQNKINQLEILCKQLLQISLQQQNSFHEIKNSIQIIQSKINYVVGNLKYNDKLSSYASQNIRQSIQNQKKIPLSKYTTTQSNYNPIHNSSQQFCRYFQPLSSQQKHTLPFQPNQIQHNQSIPKNKHQNVNPFILNSQFCQQSSLHYDDQENKQNRNQSNFQPIKYPQEINKQQLENDKLYINAKKTKKSSFAQKKQINDKNGEKTKENKNQKTQKTKNISIRYEEETEKDNISGFCKQMSKQQNYNRINYYNNKVMNQKKPIPETISKKSKSKVDNKNEMLKTNESMEIESSDVFNSVDLTNSTRPASSSIRHYHSTDLSKKHKKMTKTHHQKTLLQCIQEKKMIIDQELSKRLINNLNLIGTRQNNQPFKYKKY